MIELSHIYKKFNEGVSGEVSLFRDFSLTVPDGQFVSVIGSNGSGKSTLLNLIGGSLLPDGGTVSLDGKDITSVPEYVRARTVGRVYQDPGRGVAPGLSVAENIALAENKGKRAGLGFAVRRRDYPRYADLVRSLGLGLEEKLDVPVGLLSGGQRQALSLLMATLTPLRFLILDEHTAALDPHTADVVMELTERVVRGSSLTALMVTHNLRYAVTYGDRVLMMDRGQVVLDLAGEEKKRLRVEDVLALFNKISIECGN